MKITENLGEFQKFLDSDNKTGMCLETRAFKAINNEAKK